MCLQIMLVGSAWECVCRSCWLGLQLLPNSGSCGELMPCWWIVGTLGTVSNAAFSLLPCSLPDSPLLELWAFFPFFCRLWTEGQTHSQAARRHFFPWVITVLDMTKFVQVCNGSNVPRCPRGCEGMKGSMHPHVLKWSVSLSRETSTVGRNPAQRRPCSPSQCEEVVHRVLGWNEEPLGLSQHTFPFPRLLPSAEPGLVPDCFLCSVSSLSSSPRPLCLEQALPCSLPIQQAPLLTCSGCFISEGSALAAFLHEGQGCGERWRFRASFKLGDNENNYVFVFGSTHFCIILLLFTWVVSFKLIPRLLL